MIGIFDSGVGGLTVARELMRQLPGASFLYVGDTARAPYGNKSSETIRRYAQEHMRWLQNHGATLFVVACNTLSTLGAEFFAGQTSWPVFDVIGPAVDEALWATRNGNIGLIGTRATIGSGIYERQLQKENDVTVHSAACPLLAPLVEEGWLDRPETEMIVRQYLEPLLEKSIDTLILGCTHYPFLAPMIQKVVGENVRLVDSAVTTINHLKKHLEEQAAVRGETTSRFFLTDRAPHYDMMVSRWMKRPITFEKVFIDS